MKLWNLHHQKSWITVRNAVTGGSHLLKIDLWPLPSPILVSLPSNTIYLWIHQWKQMLSRAKWSSSFYTTEFKIHQGLEISIQAFKVFITPVINYDISPSFDALNHFYQGRAIPIPSVQSWARNKYFRLHHGTRLNYYSVTEIQVNVIFKKGFHLYSV